MVLVVTHWQVVLMVEQDSSRSHVFNVDGGRAMMLVMLGVIWTKHESFWVCSFVLFDKWLTFCHLLEAWRFYMSINANRTVRRFLFLILLIDGFIEPF